MDRFSSLMRNYDPEYSVDLDFSQMFFEAYKTGAERAKTYLFAIEQNVLDIGNLLERLLGYRREIVNSEAERLKTYLAYTNALAIAKHERDIEIFKKPNASRLFKRAINAKLQTTTKYILDLKQRHRTSASPLNFSQRLEKLRELARRDIESLTPRIIALTQLGSVDPLLYIPSRPSLDSVRLVSFDGAAHLDDLVAWHREVTRNVQALRSIEVTHDVTISLGQPQLFISPYSNPDSRYRTVSLVPQLVESIKNEKTAFFDLGDDIPHVYDDGQDPDFNYATCPFDIRFARIKAVALSASTITGRYDWSFNVRLSIPGVYSDIVLRAPHSSRPIEWASGPAIINRPPSGAWSVDVINAISNDEPETQANRSAWPITDLKLHLRLMSK